MILIGLLSWLAPDAGYWMGKKRGINGPAILIHPMWDVSTEWKVKNLLSRRPDHKWSLEYHHLFHTPGISQRLHGKSKVLVPLAVVTGLFLVTKSFLSCLVLLLLWGGILEADERWQGGFSLGYTHGRYLSDRVPTEAKLMALKHRVHQFKQVRLSMGLRQPKRVILAQLIDWREILRWLIAGMMGIGALLGFSRLRKKLEGD